MREKSMDVSMSIEILKGPAHRLNTKDGSCALQFAACNLSDLIVMKRGAVRSDGKGLSVTSAAIGETR